MKSCCWTAVHDLRPFDFLTCVGLLSVKQPEDFWACVQGGWGGKSVSAHARKDM
jgi:hypothetical protein